VKAVVAERVFKGADLESLLYADANSFWPKHKEVVARANAEVEAITRGIQADETLSAEQKKDRVLESVDIEATAKVRRICAIEPRAQPVAVARQSVPTSKDDPADHGDAGALKILGANEDKPVSKKPDTYTATCMILTRGRVDVSYTNKTGGKSTTTCDAPKNIDVVLRKGISAFFHVMPRDENSGVTLMLLVDGKHVRTSSGAVGESITIGGRWDDEEVE